MATTLGIDCSVWQDNDSTPQMMDFAKSKAAGAKFVFIKASQGGALDGDYVNNWLHAEGVLPRGAYHFYDWRISYQTQIDFFCQIINNDPGELPPMLDYESRISVPAKASAYPICLKFLRDVRERTGIAPILYTSPSYWLEFGANVAAFKDFDLFIANYQVARPTVPLPWTKWTLWQFGVFPRGKEFGAESASIDLDYFNGTLDELKIWAGIIPPPPTVEDRLADLEERVKRLEEINHLYLPSIQK